MRLALCAVVATLATVQVPSAGATPPAGGEKCALTVVPDYFADDGWQGGELRAGPLVTGEAGTLVCEVHVNNNSHGGSAVASASFVATANGVVFGTAPVVYPASDADTVSLCAEWHSASGTWYWRGGNTTTGDQGSWSSSPTSCGELLTVDPITSLPPGAGPQCYDGVDNDGDGRRDYPADPDCSNVLDSESAPSGGSCTTVAGVPVCASYTPGTQRTPHTVYGPATTGMTATGWVDVYEFTLPNGGTVTVPCVVLPAANACAAAGGRYVSRTATLGPVTAPVPTGALTVPLATVYVCDADLVLTVNDIGITSFPAYAVC